MEGLQKQLDELSGDEAGVSPVIGVILMVAVTVIIAAVIGSSALGISDEVSESPPTAQFETELVEKDYTMTSDYGTGDADVVYIEHNGGESIDLSNINIQVDSNEAYTIHRDEDPTVEDAPSGTYYGSSDVHPNADGYPDLVPVEEFFDDEETLAAGDSIPILAANTDNLDMENNDNNIYYLAQNEDVHVHHRDSSDYDSDEVGLKPGAKIVIQWESGSTSQVLYEGTI